MSDKKCCSGTEAAAENNECRYKHTPRDEKTVHALKSRLNRITGQLNGIKNMLDENRYCGDILIQIAAAESALQNVGYMILKEHMDTCMTEKIKNGDTGVTDEVFELVKKLK